MTRVMTSLLAMTYQAWLKKPNQFRVEATRFGQDEPSGVLVGDGDHLWIFWPGGKPCYNWENSGEFAAEYEKYRLTSYMKICNSAVLLLDCNSTRIFESGNDCKTKYDINSTRAREQNIVNDDIVVEGASNVPTFHFEFCDLF